jgi:hypothetical protein
MVEIDNRKAALIAELEISRGEIRKAVRECEESLDVVSLVRRKVGANLKYWLPGAALGGWILSKLFSASLSPRAQKAPGAPRAAGSTDAHPGPSPRGVASSAGWILALGKIGFEMLRPQLLAMASDWVARKTSPPAAQRPHRHPNGARMEANGPREDPREPARR